MTWAGQGSGATGKPSSIACKYNKEFGENSSLVRSLFQPQMIFALSKRMLFIQRVMRTKGSHLFRCTKDMRIVSKSSMTKNETPIANRSDSPDSAAEHFRNSFEKSP